MLHVRLVMDQLTRVVYHVIVPTSITASVAILHAHKGPMLIQPLAPVQV